MTNRETFRKLGNLPSQRDFSLNSTLQTNNYYINQINEKDKEIAQLKNEINKIKQCLNSKNNNNKKNHEYSLSSYKIKKNSNVDDILKHCEKIINSKDINITTLKLSTLSSSLSNLKQKAEYILDLYSNKFKKKK